MIGAFRGAKLGKNAPQKNTLTWARGAQTVPGFSQISISGPGGPVWRVGAAQGGGKGYLLHPGPKKLSPGTPYFSTVRRSGGFVGPPSGRGLAPPKRRKMGGGRGTQTPRKGLGWQKKPQQHRITGNRILAAHRKYFWPFIKLTVFYPGPGKKKRMFLSLLNKKGGQFDGGKKVGKKKKKGSAKKQKKMKGELEAASGTGFSLVKGGHRTPWPKGTQ